ncbi:hypothetical protein HY251_07375 [bacterium]|nr:hypothetical protein [bacterium]
MARARAFVSVGSIGLTAILVAACGQSGGSIGAPVPALPIDDGQVPLVLVHGHLSSADEFLPLIANLGPGHTSAGVLTAADADALAPNSLPPDVIVAFEYYKESPSSAIYDPDSLGKSHGSIGACPVPRDDGLDGHYTVSYAQRLKRCVEGLKRATGRSRVDIYTFSMGGTVARAYTRWLSVDASGQCSVRRLLLGDSGMRGHSALESLASYTREAQDPALAFMVEGEVAETCGECRIYGGKSFLEVLNDDWDSFCVANGIHYGGISGTGAVPPSSTLAGRFATWVPVAQTFPYPSTLATQVMVKAMTENFSQEAAALSDPNDGTERFSVTRLDQPPFSTADFFTTYEGDHTGPGERGIRASVFAQECIRGYLFGNGRVPDAATVTTLSLTAVDAPGKATWLLARIQGGAASALSGQLVEKQLDASGNTTAIRSYALPVGPGDERLMFVVEPGGGTRSYRLVVYGARGPVATLDGIVLSLVDGATETAPLATILDATATATPDGVVVHGTVTSNASSNDTTVRYRVRFDYGAWSPYSTETSSDSPAFKPGVHRVDVLTRSSSNAAGVLVDGAVSTGLDIVVDGSGGVTIVR